MPTPTIYVETSVISLCIGPLSRDLVMAARQQVTREWWDTRREKHHVFASAEVVRECSAGDVNYAADRLALLKELPVIPVTPVALALAGELVDSGVLPPKARTDALHIALAAFDHAAILLTWNMRHLANPVLLPRVRDIITRHDLTMPEVCTPQALMEADDATG